MWLFETPERAVPTGSARDPLWGRYSTTCGVAVGLRTDGSYGLFDVVDPETYPQVTKWWQGGRSHTVTDAEAAGLSSAGYGPYLTEVTS